MKRFFIGLAALVTNLAAHAQPDCSLIIQASFTSTVQGNIVVVTNTSVSQFPQATTYQWAFGDGMVTDGANVTHIYDQPGTYQICLYAIVENCVDTVCDEVTIQGGDPCLALADVVTTLVPQQGGVSFAYDNVPTYANTMWYFGDGTSSEDAQGFHQYTGPGTYTVCLWAWFIIEGTTDTCSTETCHPVTVEGGPDPCDVLQAGFFANVSPNGAQFSNGTTGTGFSTTWSWTFGDGTGSNDAQPFHEYSEPGNYLVCLTAISIYEQNGGVITCVDSTCQELEIPGEGSPCEELNAAFNPVAAGLSVNIQNAQVEPGWSYVWDFGDGTGGDGPNPFHVYDQPGEYQICLIVGTYDPIEQDSCFADNCAWITIGGGDPCDGLQAGFFANVGDVTVWFSNGTTGTGFQTSWYWDFGDGTTSSDAQPSHIFPGLGTYEVCLTVTSIYEQLGGGVITCQDSTCQVVVTGGGSPCNSLTAEFAVTLEEDLAAFTSSGGTAIGYLWNFGDGTEGDGPAPMHTYPGPGAYHACLITWTWDPQAQDTCFADYCQWVILAGDDPCDTIQSCFTWSGTGNSFFFDNCSSINGLGPSYHWDFGDGSESDAISPDHTFQEPGAYTVCLTGWLPNSPDSCSSTVCHIVFVGEGGSPCDGLNAEFTAWPGGLGVNFQNAVINPSWTYQWYFDDGSEGDGPNPFHIYPDTGWYVVCLVVGTYDPMAEDSCFAEYCTGVQVGGGGSPCDSLNADLWWQQSGGPTNIFYSATSGNASHWLWTFGDGSASDDGPQGTHEYAEPGTYQICLTAWYPIPGTQDTCSASSCQWITVGGSPCDSLEAGFEAIVGDATVWFTNTTSGTGFQTTWLWDFGDGTTSSDEQPSHIFPGLDSYEVCLTVTSIFEQQGGGVLTCQNTYCQPVITGGDSPCGGLNAEFTAIATGNTVTVQAGFNPPGTSFQWIFGDGTFGDGANNTHTYPGAGTYNLCLIVGNYDPLTQDSCFEDHCVSITLLPGGNQCDSLWTASFEFGHQGTVYTFFNTSDTQGAEVSTQWTFGDGSLGDGTPAIHTYTASGNYTVCMTIAGIIPGTDDSCQVEVCQTIEVSVGIEELVGALPINAWPQPFDGLLQLEGPGLLGNTRSTLLDMTGRIIDDRYTLAHGRMALDFADLPPGAYLLRLRNDIIDRSLRVVKR